MAQVIPGFSLTNRLLIYASLLLTPAQGIAGIDAKFPTSLGFLAYNWYNQWVWYNAIRQKQLHALSIVTVHFSQIYAITYLGGIPHHSAVVRFLLGLGTVGVMLLNCVASWISWATNQPEGYGVYQFFFFGWRRLTPGWHTFFLLWQIEDTFLTLSCIIVALGMSALCGTQIGEDIDITYGIRLLLIATALLMLIAVWPLILWMELIVARNHIQSETDMIAVWLFIAQVVLMVLPGGFTALLKWSYGFTAERVVKLSRFVASRGSAKDPEAATPTNDVPLELVRKA